MSPIKSSPRSPKVYTCLPQSMIRPSVQLHTNIKNCASLELKIEVRDWKWIAIAIA